MGKVLDVKATAESESIDRCHRQISELKVVGLRAQRRAMGAARRLRFRLRAAAMALLVLPSLLLGALAEVPPVVGAGAGGGPFAEDGGGYGGGIGGGSGGPGGVHNPPISFMYGNQYIPTECGGGYGGGSESGSGYGGPDGVHSPPMSFVYDNKYMPTGRRGSHPWSGRRTNKTN